MSEKMRRVPPHKHVPSDIVETPEDMILPSWRHPDDPTKPVLRSLASIPDGFFPASDEGRKKFEDEFVDTAKIAGYAVTGPKIADLAVETSKIKDAAITSPKLSNDAIMFSESLYGLVLLLPFDMIIDSKVFDWSGEENDGTVYGATLVDGRFGEALNFDGVDDFVEVPHSASLNVTQGLTLLAWVKLTDPSLDQKIVGKTTIGDGYVMGVSGNRLYSEIWDSTGERFSLYAGDLVANQWHRLAVTWKTGGRFRGYIDGVKVADVAASSNPIGTNLNPLRIGCAPWDPKGLLVKGIIDEVCEYSRELSADEILSDYRSGSLKRITKITENMIKTGAITTEKISTGAVIAEKIAANAITAEKVAANAITTDKINAYAVTAVKLAANSVTAEKVAANAIVTEKLAAEAVTAAKLSAGAVTTDKIYAQAVSIDKIEPHVASRTLEFIYTKFKEYSTGEITTRTSAEAVWGINVWTREILNEPKLRYRLRKVYAEIKSELGSGAAFRYNVFTDVYVLWGAETVSYKDLCEGVNDASTWWTGIETLGTGSHSYSLGTLYYAYIRWNYLGSPGYPADIEVTSGTGSRWKIYKNYASAQDWSVYKAFGFEVYFVPGAGVTEVQLRVKICSDTTETNYYYFDVTFPLDGSGPDAHTCRFEKMTVVGAPSLSSIYRISIEVLNDIGNTYIAIGHLTLSGTDFAIMNAYDQGTYVEKDQEIDNLGSVNTTLRLAYHIGCSGTSTNPNIAKMRYPASDVRGVSYLEEVI